MAELTSAAIRYEIRTGDTIVNWQHVASGWTDGFMNLYNDGIRSAAKLWLGTILYLEYLSFVSPNGVMEGFDPLTAMRADSDIGIETKDDILQGSLRVRSRVDLIPGMVNPIEAPLTGSSSKPVSDPEISFEEWLEEQEYRLRMESRFGGIGRSRSEEEE